MPEISCVIPAYNAGLTIRASLESLVGQDFLDWEAIVVDDGSTDRTAEIAESLGDSRIRVFRRPHLGIVPALNFGLLQARGNLIARQDADDRSEQTRFTDQVAHLNQKPELGLVSCLVSHDADDGDQKTRGYSLYCDWLNTHVSSSEIRRASFIESPLAHPTVLFRRSLIDTFGDYKDGPFPEDYELWLRWLDRGVRMEKVPKSLYVWKDSPGRLSRTDDRYRAAAFLELRLGSLVRWLKPRDVVIWGTGPVARKSARYLASNGKRIVAFIDLDPRKRGRSIGNAPILLLDEFDRRPSGFILSFVGNRGAGAEIRGYLLKKGLREDDDFLICS